LAQIKLGQSEVGRVIQSGGATRRTTEPEKTDGSARGSWGLELRKHRETASSRARAALFDNPFHPVRMFREAGVKISNRGAAS